MSSGAPHRLMEKKGKQLSKFLGIDSVPSTRLIATMQARINNPLFKLSMTDYEDMCGNKRMIRMMSKVIGCEEKQLKKFCKYINVFAENIKSSPKSIKNKMKITNSINALKRRGSLHILPDDILEKIVNKYKTLFKIKYKLKDWIPPAKLDWEMLSENPNAIDLLKDNLNKIDWDALSANSGAIELLKANPDKINWDALSENPNAIELLQKNIHEINWDILSTNPSAIELLKANPSKIKWRFLSSNSNPEAIELLKKYHYEEIDWLNLSLNPNPKAIELLRENQDKIDWLYLSRNPRAIELLRENQDKIDWPMLSKNPAAIELLKENLEKIDWMWLSANPNPEAIELLKANPEKIFWTYLSENPEAIELLKTNQKKISWTYLSGNPAIFDEIYTTYTKSPPKLAKSAKASKVGNAKKECPVGKELNPLTKRCIKICEKDKIRDPVTRRCKKKCPVGKEFNPLTKRCIKICEKDKIRDPVTGKCKKI
jgi:hypothetical protein